jgi:uncharacterized protein DUF1801
MKVRAKSGGSKNIRREIRNPDVEAIFSAYLEPVRAKLESLRRLIFATARATEGVGALEETLKWGQPSYLTTATNSGSTIRIAPVKSDPMKSDPGKYAMYFHCQTNLVATFRDIYPRELTYGGNRSILFEANEAIDEEALRHCISLALTYHARKSANPPKAAPSPKSRR